MILTFAVVCEHESDLRTAGELADRVVVETIDWLEAELLPHLRQWRGLSPEDTCLIWSNVPKESATRGVKIRGGFSKQDSHRFDAKLARRALILLSEMEPPPDAILLIRDGDKQSDDRRASLVGARENAENDFLRGKPIVVGLADPMKECWILAGFMPDSEVEEERLASLRQELGFDPTAHPERLTASDVIAKKSPKRVLKVLCGEDPEREKRCWKETKLSVLKTRGNETGLTKYLCEVKKKIVPIIEGRGRSL